MGSEYISVVVGVFVPVLIAMIKSKIELNREQTYGVAFLVCTLLSVAILSLENRWGAEDIMINISIIFSTSQLVYANWKKEIEQIEGNN